LSDGIGKKASVTADNETLTRGIFLGIDKQGRLILDAEKRSLFRPGSVSVKFGGN
jgi:biotin-(acetyl-CoA carboxylase) ligase